MHPDQCCDAACARRSRCRYLYDDAPGPHRPKGRVLVPLNDVVWPTKEGVSFQRLRSGFQPAEKPYVRRDESLHASRSGAATANIQSPWCEAFWSVGLEWVVGGQRECQKRLCDRLHTSATWPFLVAIGKRHRVVEDEGSVAEPLPNAIVQGLSWL